MYSALYWPQKWIENSTDLSHLGVNHVKSHLRYCNVGASKSTVESLHLRFVLLANISYGSSEVHLPDTPGTAEGVILPNFDSL